ncbi:MAG: hypothetical protein H3C68_02430 [Deltaproteobacteria bacterium]|nr:hypothetical protein [Deltaproteobacteria bacterium]MBZ0218886.1 hypothetical protein [Deltaproteobacteria bacterium]
MSPNRGTAARLAIIAALFLLGITIGTVLWDEIVLPFSNPWKVVGPMTLLGYNPGNNILRFVVFVISPALVLTLAFLISKRLRGFLFTPPVLPPAAYAKTEKRAVLIVMALSVIVALNSPSIMGELDIFHEGESLGASISYEAGLAPYKDFIFAHGVYQDPLRSILAFKLFGRSISSARTLDNIQNVLAFVLLGVLVLKLFRGSLLAASAMVLFAGLYWTIHLIPSQVLGYILIPFIMPRDLTIFGFLIAGLSIHTLAHAEKPRPIVVFISGLAFSFIPIASFAYSVDRGFYLFTAFVVLAPLAYIFLLRRNKVFLTSLIFGALTSIVLLVLLLRGGTAEFIGYVFFTMPKYKELMDGLVYPFNVWSAFLACVLCAFNAFWITKRFFGELNSNGIGAPGTFLKGYFPELMLFMLSIFIFRGALGRSDLDHIASSIYPASLLFVYIMTKHYGTYLPRKFRFFRGAGAFAAIVLVFAVLFGAYRIYALGLIHQNFPVSIKDEEFIPANYKATISFLEKEIGGGETFFNMTSEAIWYYFLNQPSMTRFPVIWFAAPEFYQKEVAYDLERKKVKYIIFSNFNGANYIDGISTKTRLPILTDHIRKEYRFLRWIDDNEIWIRKDASEEVFKAKPAY